MVATMKNDDRVAPDTETVSAGGGFVLHSVQEEDDPVIDRCGEMLSEEFTPDELPDPGSVREAVRGNLQSGATDRYIFEALLDGGGRVHGFVKGLYRPLDDGAGGFRRDGVAMVGYIMMQRESRGNLALTRSLFRRFREKSEEAARQLGGALRYFAGEAVPAVEPMLNWLGLRRCYIEREERLVEEFRYFQPPLRWDPESGCPLHDAGAAAEHFMIGAVEEGMDRLSAVELMAAVRCFHYYVYEKFWPMGAFRNSGAFQRSRKMVRVLEEVMERQLAQVESVFLVSKSQRRRMEREGVRVIGHDEADLRGE